MLSLIKQFFYLIDIMPTSSQIEFRIKDFYFVFLRYKTLPDIHFRNIEKRKFYIFDIDMENNEFYSFGRNQKFLLDDLINDLKDLDDFSIILKYGRYFTDEYILERVSKTLGIEVTIQDFDKLFEVQSNEFSYS